MIDVLDQRDIDKNHFLHAHSFPSLRMSSNTSSVPEEQNPYNDYTTVSIVAISDTHSMYSRLKFDPASNADILIHAGDLTNRGTKEELEDAIDWLASLPFKHKILIAGNHDVGLDKLC